MYIGYFNRAPEAGGLNYWSNYYLAQFNAGKDDAAIQKDIANQFYSAAVQYNIYSAGTPVGDFIKASYLNALGRTSVDDAGMTYWTAKLTSGEVSRGEFVQKLISDAKGFASDATYGWVSKYLYNRMAVAKAFAAANTTTGDAAITAGKAALSAVTPAAVQAGQTKEEALAAAAGFGGTSNAGNTFTLTASVDNIIGAAGNDVINGVLSATAGATTLTGLDSIDGAGGTDTLNISDTLTAATAAIALPGGLTVKNVENLSIVSSGNFGVAAGTALDLSTTFAGVEKATLIAAGTTGGSNVKVADTTALNLTQAAGAVVTAGGKSVSVVNAGTGTTGISGKALTEVAVKGGGAVTVNNFKTAAGTDDNQGTTLTKVTLDTVDANSGIGGAALTEVTVMGATTAARTVTVTNATLAHSLTVNAAGTGYNALGTTEYATVIADAAATSLVINSTGAKNSIATTGSNALTNVTVKGAAALALGTLTANVKTLNAADSTGGITVAGGAALQQATGGTGKDSITLAADLADKGFVKTGAGNDKVDIAANAVAKGAVIELGDGDDSFVGTGAVNKDAVIDGGAGKDTLAAKLVNAVNVGAFKNFENLDLVGLGNATLDADLFAVNNTIEKLVLSGASGHAAATVTNVAAGVGLEITASDTDGVVIGQKGVTTGGTVVDKFSVTLNAAANADGTAKTVTAASVTLNSINEVSIVSGGGAKVSNVLSAIVSDEMKTLNITGTNALTLTNLYKSGTTATDVLTTIDASGQTAGGLKMDLAAVNGALTVKLGAGDDVISASINSNTPTTVSSVAALDKIANFDKATDAELTASKGFDLIKFVDKHGTPVDFAVKANAAGSATTVKIVDGVIDFSGLTTGPTTLTAAVAQVDTDVTTNGSAAVFQYGSSSYLFVQNGAADVVIELTGVTGVTKLAEVGTTDSFYVM